MTDPSRAKTVSHALALLRAFAQQAEWRVSDLARQLDLPLAVIHRLVRTMVDEDFLEQPVERGPYVLGPALTSLAQSAAQRRTLSSVAHRELLALAQKLDEAVDLCVMREHRYICVDSVDLTGRTRSVVELGDSAGLHAGAAGKVILAFQSDAFIEQVVTGPLLRLTDRTLAEQQLLVVELDRIRTQGYAYSESEVTMGTCSLAAPIRDGSGRVVAAVNVFTSTERMAPGRRDSIVEQLLPVAEKLSHGLGHTWDLETSTRSTTGDW